MFILGAMIETNDCFRLQHRRRLPLEYRRSTALVRIFEFDQTGQHVPCKSSNSEDLVRLADGVNDIRAIKHGGNLSAAMEKVVDCLYDLSSRPADGDEVPFEFACYATRDAYDEVLATSRMHALAGLSPDGSTLFVVFAPFSIRAGVAQAECQ
jgi:hypothetical protein